MCSWKILQFYLECCAVLNFNHDWQLVYVSGKFLLLVEIFGSMRKVGERILDDSVALNVRNASQRESSLRAITAKYSWRPF